jgi:hypothetical protein
MGEAVKGKQKVEKNKCIDRFGNGRNQIPRDLFTC